MTTVLGALRALAAAVVESLCSKTAIKKAPVYDFTGAFLCVVQSGSLRGFI